MTLTDTLERDYPTISWREPIKMAMSGKSGYACRICIAAHGIRGTDTHRLMTYDKAIAHIREQHA